MTRSLKLGTYAGLLCLSTIVTAAESPLAPSGTYRNDPTHTSLLWRIQHMGLSNYTARMNDVSIILEYNAEDVAESQVQATVGAGSVDTGYPLDNVDFDAEIANEKHILNSGEHPTISFQSTRIRSTSPTTAILEGELTLLGITRAVSMNVQLNGQMASHPFVKVPALGFTAVTTLDRTEFGLDFLSGTGLADVVEIVVQAELIKQ